MTQRKRAEKPVQSAKRTGTRVKPARKLGPPYTAISIIVLILLNLYVFRDHWRGLTTFPWDFGQAYYAFTGYWITSIQMGEWPHWIPYQALGFPSALNPQLDLFYFPFWFFIIFQIPYTLHAATVLQVLHVLFGSIGFLLFALRCFGSKGVALCGAAAFAFFGGFYTNSEHVDVIRAFSWVPWIFWALLLDESVADRTFARWRIHTRFRTPNLFLPLIVCFFLTGAYPGSFIAGLLIAAAFIATQAAALWWRFRDRVSWYDGAAQAGQIALALGMALVFLLPSAYMSRELVRTQEMDQLGRRYLFIPGLYHLFIPSNFLSVGSDFTMEGMQIPVLLLLLVPLVRIRRTLLIPVLATAALSAVMCLHELIPIRSVITTLLPPLRLSRFPAGDFRLYIYIGVMICALSGLQQLIENRNAFWRNILKIGGAVLVLALLYIYRIGNSEDGIDGPRISAWMWRDGAYCAAFVLGYVLLWRMNWLRSAGAYFTATACVLLMVPVVDQMKVAWNDPNAERSMYDTNGLQLMGGNERLRVERVFERQEVQRPPRLTHQPMEWLGYLDGSYLNTDKVGLLSASQQAVLADPALRDIVMSAGTIMQVPCVARICDSAEPSVHLSAGIPAGSTLNYSRNSILYQVNVPQRSLVVENELYAPGWSGICEIHQKRLDVHRVDGGLRGWVLDAGAHRLRVTYRTPWLAASAVLSALFMGCWAAMMVVWFRPQPDATSS
ncbi:MAG: hypothetical protein ABJF23_11130 [Bryobacteraceae bacterium]